MRHPSLTDACHHGSQCRFTQTAESIPTREFAEDRAVMPRLAWSMSGLTHTIEFELCAYGSWQLECTHHSRGAACAQAPLRRRPMFVVGTDWAGFSGSCHGVRSPNAGHSYHSNEAVWQASRRLHAVEGAGGR